MGRKKQAIITSSAELTTERREGRGGLLALASRLGFLGLLRGLFKRGGGREIHRWYSSCRGELFHGLLGETGAVVDVVTVGTGA